MRFDRKFAVIMTLILMSTIGAKCITVNDDANIWVNVDEITGTYNITPGALQFANPNDCVTKQPADYINSDYGLVVGGNLVDIRYQAFGTFAGNVTNGRVTVNGVQIISYSGPWTTFTTQRSLLTGTELSPNPAGVQALLTAIENSQAITICVGGSFSQSAPAGLSVKVDVLAQLEVEPD